MNPQPLGLTVLVDRTTTCSGRGFAAIVEPVREASVRGAPSAGLDCEHSPYVPTDGQQIPFAFDVKPTIGADNYAEM